MNLIKIICRCLLNLIAATLCVALYSLLQAGVLTWLPHYKVVTIVAGVMAVVAIGVLLLTKDSAYEGKLVEWPVMVTVVAFLIPAVQKIVE